LRLALESGAVTLPDSGPVAVLYPPSDADLDALPRERLWLVQGMRPDHDTWVRRGYRVVARPADLPDSPAAAIVFVPRAKDAARAAIATACGWGGPVIVDGQKTDGTDSLWKAARKRADVGAAFSKAHGKCFQIASGATFADWVLPETAVIADGWVTAPGVFSADGPDPGSVALAGALPPLKGRVADLGAGWGYLSARVLAGSDAIAEMHLVEADHAALEAARLNVTDARARFHWADATNWSPGAAVDHVVTNPPFHTSRKAEPALGTRFIAAAAAMLSPRGMLWLVANRHLPYEQDLDRLFLEVSELPGPSAYKLIRAHKPRTPGRKR
jgi:16S rRNA (guanine1207-N2)-methyltransferase